MTEEKTNTEIVSQIRDDKVKELKANQQTTTVQLPSNGLINPDIKQVTLKRMTTLQSKALFSSNDPNFLTSLVMGCIVEPTNITTDDLHSNDILYLLFVLRHISSPKEITQQTMCTNPKCRHIFGTTVKVPELQVTYADPESIKKTVILPDSQDVIQFKILSEGDITNCDKISERKIKQRNIEYSEQDWFRIISKISYIIESVNDKGFDTFDDKVEYIEQLSAYDFEYFNNEYNKIINSFGLDRKIFTSCPKCDTSLEVEAFISPEFFRLV